MASCETDVINGRETCVRVGACTRSQRGRRDSLCPKAAVAAMPLRLLLLCLLLKSSWLTVEGGRPVDSGVLHRRGEPAAVAVRVAVAGGVPYQ